MMTPLQKHHGQRGGYIALALFLVAVAVLWVTHPAPPRPAQPAEQTKPVAVVSRAPAASIVAPVAPHDRVTATGKVAYVEKRTSRIDIPVHGLLRKVHPTALGRKIRAGETVAVIYSPEVYLTSMDVVEEVRDFRSPERLDTARNKLLRWGMRPDMLIAIESTGQPQGVLPLIARVTGVVVAEQGLPMQLVDPGADVELFTITDPTYASLYVDVPAADAARAKLGTNARITIDGLVRPVIAPVGYISHRVEDGMRTLRFDLHDPNVRFEAGKAASVELLLK